MMGLLWSQYVCVIQNTQHGGHAIVHDVLRARRSRAGGTYKLIARHCYCDPLEGVGENWYFRRHTASSGLDGAVCQRWDVIYRSWGLALGLGK